MMRRNTYFKNHQTAPFQQSHLSTTSAIRLSCFTFVLLVEHGLHMCFKLNRVCIVFVALAVVNQLSLNASFSTKRGVC